MARKNAAKHGMIHEIDRKFKQGRGNSKRNAKAKYGGVSPYIHSSVTHQTYRQQVAQYGDWLEANHPGTRFTEAANYAKEYLDTLKAEGKSPWTQQTARAAIGKALGVEPTSLGTTDKRRAANITRGRTETASAKAAATKNSSDMKICECTGIRHNKEGGQVTPANCNWENGHIQSISIIGKGGRPRTAIVLAGEGRDILEARAKAAKSPSEKLLGAMSGCNVHGARAIYAAGVYKLALETGKTNGQMYRPRNLDGKEYDKGALDYVNENLGHGEGRYDVAVYNYLSYGEKT